MSDSLTRRQQRFAEEFVKDANATQAAIRAGFSPKSAKVHASRMLTNANVMLTIERLRQPVIEAAQITLASHLASLAELRDKAIEAEQFGPAVTAEVSRGKASGLYIEKREHTFPAGAGVLAVPVQPSAEQWAAGAAAQQAALVARPARIETPQ